MLTPLLPQVRETALRSLAAMARAILGDDGRETRKADAKADAKADGTNAGAGGAGGKSEEGAGEAGEEGEGEGEGEGESEAVLAELQLSMSVGGVMSLLDDGPVAQLQATLPPGFPQATPRLPRGYPEANPRFPGHPKGGRRSAELLP